MRRLLPLLLLPQLAYAELPNEELVCPAEAPELAPEAYLRALALDLTGAPPDPALYETVGAAGLVDDALVDAYLDSDAFANRVVRRHDTLLWPNVTNVAFSAVRAQLAVIGGRYWNRQRAAAYRGDTIECLDEPARWDDVGHLVTTPSVNAATGKAVSREGWVLVQPYWMAAGTTIKVCAFDAQATPVAPSGTVCKSKDGLNDPGCGCGPNLDWCRGSDSDRQVAEAIGEDVRRRFRALIQDDRPYLDLFTSSRAFVNGPLVHYLKNRAAELANTIRFDPMALDLEALPDLGFLDKTVWVEIQLPEHHAGILTSWAYLTRFQTARARANRFYNAFLCQPFQPPASGIPIDPSAVSEPDLQKRAGCKYCHALLEPSASFWGRWTEAGNGYLAPETYPAFSEDCHACSLAGNCSRVCRDFYMITATRPGEVQNLGRLAGYAFRREEHEKNVEQGPRLLAYEGIVDGRLPSCVARSTAEWLLGRHLADAEAAWADELATTFAADGYRFKSLVRAVVTSDVYRRIR